MAQLVVDGKPICRWCKLPLTKKDLATSTRPREVHPQHVHPRRNAIANGSWTREMDQAPTLEGVESSRQKSVEVTHLAADVAALQDVLNRFHAAEGRPGPELVTSLVAASARLLRAVRGDEESASAG